MSRTLLFFGVRVAVCVRDVRLYTKVVEMKRERMDREARGNYF